YLQTLVERAKGTPIKISAQTMHEADNGAFTGEISPTMLTDIGVSHVVIGHSERREYYGETNESVNKKTKAALTHGLVPIVCVGESLEQREANETMAVVEEQVTAALKDIAEADVKKVIIAYEPIWAIGTGKTATSEQANEVCSYIRSVVETVASNETAEELIIQYGGSVNPDNVDELLAKSDIDGALVGGASIEASSFIKLLEAGNK